jgi:protein TonB
VKDWTVDAIPSPERRSELEKRKPVRSQHSGSRPTQPGGTNVTLLRISIAFFLSIAATTGLFGFMRFVTTAGGESIPIDPVQKVELPRLVLSPEVEKVRPPKPPIEKPVQEPVIAAIDVLDDRDATDLVDLAPIRKGSGLQLTAGRDGESTAIRRIALRGGIADRDAVPLVRVDPPYPPQADQRDLEGWVHLRFTIATDGSVEDADVVQSSDPVFERSALQAVAKWKYQPAIRDGAAIATPDQQVLLRFQRPD